MNTDNYNFWKMAYDMKAIDIAKLRQAVETESNPFGEITEAEFKVITGVDFIEKPTIPVTPVEPVKPTEPSEQEKPVEPAKPTEEEKPVEKPTV